MSLSKKILFFIFQSCALMLFAEPWPSNPSSKEPLRTSLRADESYYPPKKEHPSYIVSTNSGVGLVYNQNQKILQSAAYELFFGRYLGASLKLGGAYQYQSAPFHAEFTGSIKVGPNQMPYHYVIRSKADIQTFSAKLYALLPEFYAWQVLCFSPYLSCGVGPSWLYIQNFMQTRTLALSAEGGMSIGVAKFSAMVGFRGQYWLSQIRMYSLTPYIGLQVNF